MLLSSLSPLLARPPTVLMGLEMDPLVHALSYFRRRKFQLCSDLCSQLLEKEPGDQVTKKSRASGRRVCVALGQRKQCIWY